MEYRHSMVWLRRDLRLNDHTALVHALHRSDRVTLIFIFDYDILAYLPRDDRRVTFIWQSLDDIDQQLIRHKCPPILRLAGKPQVLIADLMRSLHMDALFFNQDYEPRARQRDERVAQTVTQLGCKVETFKDQVIFDAKEIVKSDGLPYRVFTAYKNRWLSELTRSGIPARPRHRLPWQRFKTPSSKTIPLVRTLNDLGFRPNPPHLPGGESAARKTWSDFLDGNLISYSEQRDLPATEGTSGLSPYLRFGNLSIRDLVADLQNKLSVSAQAFLAELIWREFFMMILYHFPHVERKNFNASFDHIRWINSNWFEAWKDGRTGFPLVDAGMRQLNETGWMHNRVRMVAASFLVKHLHVDWRLGEKYFAGRLLDYELSSNNGNWQWAAGTGVDATPYFRIFNPLSQQKRFDRDAAYIRRWVPELARYSARDIHASATDPLPGYDAPICDLERERRICIQLYRPQTGG